MEMASAPRALVVQVAGTGAVQSGAVTPAVTRGRFLQLLDGEATLEAAYVEDGALITRLFNPSPKPGMMKLQLDASLTGRPIHETRMDGSELRVVEPKGSTIPLDMGPFEVTTLKIEPPQEVTP